VNKTKGSSDIEETTRAFKISSRIAYENPSSRRVAAAALRIDAARAEPAAVVELEVEVNILNCAT